MSMQRSAFSSRFAPKPIDESPSNLTQAIFNLQLSTLNSERARLAAVLDQMTDGVLIVDSQGRIQFANPASKKLFETV